MLAYFFGVPRFLSIDWCIFFPTCFPFGCHVSKVLQTSLSLEVTFATQVHQWNAEMRLIRISQAPLTELHFLVSFQDDRTLEAVSMNGIPSHAQHQIPVPLPRAMQQCPTKNT